MAKPCGEVDEIEEDGRLWRRALDDPDKLAWDEEQHRWLPHPHLSLLFNDDLSTAWGDHLVEVHNLGPVAVLAVDPRFTLVYEVLAAAARAIGCAVMHSPPPGVSQPVDCAHASVWYPAAHPPAVRRSVRNRLARAMSIVEGESKLPPPPGA